MDETPMAEHQVNDPFPGITEICYENHIFTKSKPYLRKRTKTVAIYLYCKTSQCNAALNYVYDPANGNLTLSKTPSLEDHSTDCHPVNVEQKLEIQQAIEGLRTFAIDLYQKKKSKYQMGELVKKVKAHYHDVSCHSCSVPLPIISQSTIQYWFSQAYPVHPSKMAESLIPEDLRVINNDDWVFFQFISTEAKFIFLMNNEQRNIAHSAQILLLDGTFDSAPKPFTQVLNGSCFHDAYNRFVPLFHVLVEGKKATMYLKVIIQAFANIQFSNLKKIIFDFEAALIKALVHLFPPIEGKYEFQGCLFHWIKCIKTNFEEIYGSDNEEMMKYYYAFRELPFIEKIDVFKFIKFMQGKEDIQKFWYYFINQWGFKGGIPWEFWTVYNKTFNEISTNDGIERYHKDLDALFNQRPDLVTFIKKMYEIDTKILYLAHEESQTRHHPIDKPLQKTPDEAKNNIMKYFRDAFSKEVIEVNDEFITEINLPNNERLICDLNGLDLSKSFFRSSKKLVTKRSGKKKMGKVKKQRKKREEYKDLKNIAEMVAKKRNEAIISQAQPETTSRRSKKINYEELDYRIEIAEELI